MKRIFLLLTITLFYKVSIAQPEELFRGRHIVSGGNYGHPYTTFDRYNGDSHINQTVERIRKRIIKEEANNGKVFEAYKRLYEFSKGPMPKDDGIMVENSKGDGISRSELALWAKCNAFVFLIGLDSAARWLDTTTYNGVKSFTRRNEFRDRVYHHNSYSENTNAFHHFTGDLSLQKHDVQFGARSLILWLAAYDLLKASYELPELRASNRHVWGFGDADRNISKNSPRNKLRKLTRDIYIKSNGLFGIVEHQTGWKKNHGVTAASCLLASAQVLNDAGVETNMLKGNFLYRIFGGPGYNPTYSPIKWNKLGNEGLQENLFEGKHVWP